MLTVYDIREITGFSVSYLRACERSGKLPSVREGSRVLFTEQAVAEFMESRCPADLTVSEAARLYHVPRATLDSAIHRGNLHAVRKDGRLGLREGDLLAWIERRNTRARKAQTTKDH